MPRQKKGHEDYRRCDCLLCMGKCKDMREIRDDQRDIIEKYLVSGLDKYDTRLPNVLCGSCRVNIITKLKFNPDTDVSKFSIFDHSRLNLPKPATRSSPSCECLVCELGSSGRNVVQNNASLKNPVGRPCSSSFTSATYPLKICSSCLSHIAKGKSHKCTKSQRDENLKEFIEIDSPSSGQKIASAVLKNTALRERTNTLSLTQKQGRPVRVQLFPSRENYVPNFTVGDLAKFKADLNLSTNITLKLAQDMRAATKRKNTVEKKLKLFLIEENKKVEEFYTVENVDFKGKSGIKPVVFCSALPELVDFILLERRLFEDDLECKVGVNGGGGFLKICLNIFSHGEFKDKISKRKKYSDGVAPKDILNTSVNKLLILAIVPELPEKYENVSQLFSLLKLDEIGLEHIKIRYAADLKMINLLLGLMSHSSSHPCSWCTINKSNLNDIGVPRTFGNLKSTFQIWIDAGGDMVNAKIYGNVIHPSVLSTKSDSLVIDLVPPPELHLLLGAVNTMYSGMLSIWPDAATWVHKCNVTEDPMHGGCFNGNGCRQLLMKTDILQTTAPITVQPFVTAFKSLSDVVSACFGRELDPEFSKYIDTFREDYLELVSLGLVNITPKVHAIFHHVSEFCVRNSVGLGRHSEQASESAHSSFNKTFIKYKVGFQNPNYAMQLLKAVKEYNSIHI